jgi:hypothetical protein
MGPIVFKAMLFCSGAGALLAGGIQLYENLDFKYNAVLANMERADKIKAVSIPTGGYDVHFFDVKYISATNELFVSQKRLSGDNARKIANGEQIAITYHAGSPQTVKYAYDDQPNPWGWLIAGIVLMATFVFSIKLKNGTTSSGRDADDEDVDIA